MTRKPNTTVRGAGFSERTIEMVWNKGDWSRKVTS